MRHHIKINGTPTNRYRSCHNYKLRPPFPSFLIHHSKKKRKNTTRLSFFSRITVLSSDFPSTATPSQHRSVHGSTLSNFFSFPFSKVQMHGSDFTHWSPKKLPIFSPVQMEATTWNPSASLASRRSHGRVPHATPGTTIITLVSSKNWGFLHSPIFVAVIFRLPSSVIYREQGHVVR